MEALRDIAYGIAGWMVELAMLVCSALLGFRLAGRLAAGQAWALGLLLLVGRFVRQLFRFMRRFAPSGPSPGWRRAVLRRAHLRRARRPGAGPVLERGPTALGPVLLSHYQITVNPLAACLAAVHLAGLLFAKDRRCGLPRALFTALVRQWRRRHGHRRGGALLLLHRLYGGSGVTILALGGLLLPLLTRAGFPSSAASAW